MEHLNNILNVVVLIGGIVGTIYRLASTESKVYRAIDTCKDNCNKKINAIERTIDLHIAEYKQQDNFNKEWTEHFHAEIDGKFERLYEKIEAYQEIFSNLKCIIQKNNENSN